MLGKLFAGTLTCLLLVGCSGGRDSEADKPKTGHGAEGLSAAPGGAVCKLLDDPSKRARISADLEGKLLSVCGRLPPNPPAAAATPRKAASVPQAQNNAPGTDIRVNDPNLDIGGSTQSETTLAVAGQVVCAAWNDSGEGFGMNGFAGFGFSLDGGKTFKDGGPFPNGPSDTNFGDPSLAYSVKDNIFYFAALSSKGLSLWRSITNCQSFEYVGAIHNGTADDKELIAIDNNPTSAHFGRIYIGWSNFAAAGLVDPDDVDGGFGGSGFGGSGFGGSPSGDGGGSDPDINQSSFSDDGGKTWSTPTGLPGSGTNGQGVYPAVAPNGDVYMALVNRSFAIGGLQDQFIFKSIDGGNSWVKMPNIGTGQLQPENPADSMACGRQALSGNIRNLSSPQIAISASASAPAGYVVHAVYPYDSDGAGPDHSNVFYRRSVDGGETWSPETKLNDDTTVTDQFYPAIAASPTGVLVASWYDRRLDPMNDVLIDRFMTFSLDGGLTWAPNQRISDVSSPVAKTNPNFDGLATCYHGDYDQVVVSGNVAHVLWADDRRITATGPNPDVYYDQLSLNPSAGTVSAGAPSVSCSSAVTFKVTDQDLVGNASQAISVTTSKGDTESLLLLPQPGTPGTFTGSISTSAAPLVLGDGTLQVQDGAIITATYDDADTGNGTPAVVTTQVTVDCAPPVISNVHVVSVSAVDAVVGINASEPATLTVSYGLSCGSLTQTASSSAASQTPTAKLTGLSQGTTYFYAVTATDGVGNQGTDKNGGKCFPLTTPSIVFQETFENGLGGFVIDNTFGIGNGLWHLSQGTCNSAQPGHSIPNTLYYGQDLTCTYDNGLANEGVATSPLINVPDTSSVSLELNYFLGTEGGTFFDRASVEVSVDGGAFQVVDSTFTNVFVQPMHRAGTDTDAAGTVALLENTGVWQHATADLTPFFQGTPSASLQLRFHFNTVDAFVNDFAGFFIDDVTVFGKQKKCTTDADCPDDGLFCNGTESCGPNGTCTSSGNPCSDGIACTQDICNETTKSCTFVPNDAKCDDGLFCTGVETCDPTFGCRSSGNPCDDGIACTTNVCNENPASCSFVPNDAKCDDGLFCTGVETCNPQVGCQTTGDPCPGPDTCDETSRTCVPICFTAANTAHLAAGRAFTNKKMKYFAFGSNDALGAATAVTSLQGSGSFWTLVDHCPAPPTIDSMNVSVVGQTVTVSGTASDINNDITEVKVHILLFGFFDMNVDATGTTQWSASVQLPAGSHTVSVQAFDSTGFTSAPTPFVPFEILPPAPPTIASIGVAVNNDAVTISGTASDPNNDITSVHVVILQNGTGIASLLATGTTSWSTTINGLFPGSYSARAQAFDSSGLVSPFSALAPFDIAADATLCITAPNSSHLAAGRAFQNKNMKFFAFGSNDALGVSTAVTSLKGTSTTPPNGFWQKVKSCP